MNNLLGYTSDKTNGTLKVISNEDFSDEFKIKYGDIFSKFYNLNLSTDKISSILSNWNFKKLKDYIDSMNNVSEAMKNPLCKNEEDRELVEKLGPLENEEFFVFSYYYLFCRNGEPPTIDQFWEYRIETGDKSLLKNKLCPYSQVRCKRACIALLREQYTLMMLAQPYKIDDVLYDALIAVNPILDVISKIDGIIFINNSKIKAIRIFLDSKLSLIQTQRKFSNIESPFENKKIDYFDFSIKQQNTSDSGIYLPDLLSIQRACMRLYYY